MTDRADIGADHAVTNDEVDRVESELHLIDAAVYGTIPQRVRIEELIYAAYQAPIEKCMAVKGFSYSSPPMWHQFDEWTSPNIPGGYSALVEMDQNPAPQRVFAVGHRLKAQLAYSRSVQESPNAGYASLPPDGQADYDSALATCQPQFGTYGAIGSDLVPIDLLAAYEDLLSDAVSSPEVVKLMAGYPSCMKARAFHWTPPASTKMDLFSQRPISSTRSCWGSIGRMDWTVPTMNRRCSLRRLS